MEEKKKGMLVFGGILGALGSLLLFRRAKGKEPEEPSIPKEPKTSDLLVALSQTLEDALLKVDAGQTNVWIMVPGYGLSHPDAAIPIIQSLMVEEAKALGLITSASEVYFDGYHMYYTDGTWIV